MAAISNISVSLPAPKRSGRRIPELDGIRGLAIAMVLAFHYFAGTLPAKNFLYYALLPTHLMWSGVDLFFVLSGFLIGGILLDQRESQGYYSVFYLRRFHRIFPLYYLMIALFLAGRWLLPHAPIFVGRMPLWVYPLYAQNLMGDYTKAAPWFGPTWSLAVEEQFYLLFPAIVRVFNRKALLIFLGLCVAGAPVLRTILILHGNGPEQVHALLPCRADTLALGVMAALIMRSEGAKMWVLQKRGVLYACLSVLILGIASTVKWTNYLYAGAVGYSMFAFMYFLLIVLLLVTPFAAMSRFFRLRTLGWLGVVSYCVYLIHEPVRTGVLYLLGLQSFDGRVTLGTVCASIASFAVTLGIAQISWILLERRLIERAHKRYRYSTTGAVTTA